MGKLQFLLTSLVLLRTVVAVNLQYERMKNDIPDIIRGATEDKLPEFTDVVENRTVVAGREAVLSCHVNHLGSYKVAWVRVDTQTILTIHNSIITRNQRVSLSHREHKEWKLHISNVQEVDRGWYMCQVNTDPMRSKRGYIEVQVPPTIMDGRSSNDLVVREKEKVNLTCEARGYPEPQILWRREDGKAIMASGQAKGKATSVSSTSLVFNSVGRGHIGSYLCIASNGVPPSISKRVDLRVQFPPMMTVPSQLEGAHIGGNVSLRCKSEAFPASINYWVKGDRGETVTSGPRISAETQVNNHITQMRLDIKEVRENDITSYRCVAKNSLGETDGKIRLYALEDKNEVKKPKTTTQPTLATYSFDLTTRSHRRRRTSPPSFRMYEPHTPRHIGFGGPDRDLGVTRGGKQESSGFFSIRGSQPRLMGNNMGVRVILFLAFLSSRFE